GRVEENALLDDGRIVGMQGQPAGVDIARAFEAAGLHLERAVTAGGVRVHPFADRIAFEARRDLFGPRTAIGIDAAVLAQLIEADVGDFRRDYDFERLVGDHHPRHARREALD